MSKYIRRFILILMLPMIAIGFTIGEFVWWLMSGKSDPKDIYRTFIKVWKA